VVVCICSLLVTKAGIEGLAFLFGGLEIKVIKYLIAYHQGYVLWLFAFEGCWKQKQVLKDWPFNAKAWKGKSLPNLMTLLERI
jgi:hypothetical protein